MKNTSLSIPYFNSIKVRLERQSKRSEKREDQFQFHKGTIRTRGINPGELVDRDFNSIKVRLEPFFFSVLCLKFSGFQFHKGTIRTGFKVNVENETISLFQFHKGTIRT